MLIERKIVCRELKEFNEVSEYVDEYDYELFYSEYEQLVKKEFYEFDDGYTKQYIPVEVLSVLMREYDYLLSVCTDIEEFLEEIDCIIFDEHLFK